MASFFCIPGYSSKGNQTILMGPRELWPRRSLTLWEAGRGSHSNKTSFRERHTRKAVVPNKEWTQNHGVSCQNTGGPAPLKAALTREVEVGSHTSTLPHSWLAPSVTKSTSSKRIQAEPLLSLLLIKTYYQLFFLWQWVNIFKKTPRYLPVYPPGVLWV